MLLKKFLKKDTQNKTLSLQLCPLPLCGRLSQTVLLAWLEQPALCGWREHSGSGYEATWNWRFLQTFRVEKLIGNELSQFSTPAPCLMALQQQERIPRPWLRPRWQVGANGCQRVSVSRRVLVCEFQRQKQNREETALECIWKRKNKKKHQIKSASRRHVCSWGLMSIYVACLQDANEAAWR